MSELLNALRRNLAAMEEIGDEDNAKILRKRIKAEEGEPEPDPEPEPHPAGFATDDEPDPVVFGVLADMTKADLVELAEAAGVETKGLTKAELVEALEGTT